MHGTRLSRRRFGSGSEEERERAKAKEEELDPGQRDEILQGNPLLHIHGDPADGDVSTRRRWDEDVVFRNQTRNQPKKQKRFINDTIRSDFHRRFLDSQHIHFYSFSLFGKSLSK